MADKDAYNSCTQGMGAFCHSIKKSYSSCLNKELRQQPIQAGMSADYKSSLPTARVKVLKWMAMTKQPATTSTTLN